MILTAINAIYAIGYRSLLDFTSAVQYMKYFIYNFNMLAVSCELLN